MHEKPSMKSFSGKTRNKYKLLRQSKNKAIEEAKESLLKKDPYNTRDDHEGTPSRSMLT